MADSWVFLGIRFRDTGRGISLTMFLAIWYSYGRILMRKKWQKSLPQGRLWTAVGSSRDTHIERGTCQNIALIWYRPASYWTLEVPLIWRLWWRAGRTDQSYHVSDSTYADVMQTSPHECTYPLDIYQQNSCLLSRSLHNSFLLYDIDYSSLLSTRSMA